MRKTRKVKHKTFIILIIDILIHFYGNNGYTIKVIKDANKKKLFRFLYAIRVNPSKNIGLNIGGHNENHR